MITGSLSRSDGRFKTRLQSPKSVMLKTSTGFRNGLIFACRWEVLVWCVASNSKYIIEFASSDKCFFLCRVGTEAIEMTSSLSAYLESISKWTVDVFTYASDCTVLFVFLDRFSTRCYRKKKSKKNFEGYRLRTQLGGRRFRVGGPGSFPLPYTRRTSHRRFWILHFPVARPAVQPKKQTWPQRCTTSQNRDFKWGAKFKFLGSRILHSQQSGQFGFCCHSIALSTSKDVSDHA